MGVHLEAIPLFEKSLSLMDSDDEKAVVWNKLGDAFRQIGDYNRAVSAYQAADEFNGKAAESETESLSVTTELNEVENDPEQLMQVAQEPEMMADIASVQSSFDSKEPRSEADPVVENDELDVVSETKEVSQVLDGDHLVMLDKTLTEIEDILSRQNNMVDRDSVTEINPEESDLSQEENPYEDDKKDALEWNEIGNTYLIAGEYDDAIFAYTRAIEMAPDFNWPYIKNLAMAYYQKGKNRQEDELELSDAEGNSIFPEADQQDIGSMHELDNLSSEIFSTEVPEVEPDSTTTTSSLSQEEIFTLDSSSIVEPFSFDVNSIEKDLLQEAMQEDMDFNSGRSRDVFPANQELVDSQSFGKFSKENTEGEDPSEVEITPGKEKFEVQPKNAYEWNELGNIYLKIGSNDKAIESFNKAIELDPYFGWAYSNLALAYNHSKKFKESIPLYKKSIELLDTDKGKAISYNRLGDVYRHMNDQDNAMKAYQMASDLDGNTKPILARARMVLLNNA
jgi:tetratricopeptide (TPR) repeat protein